MWVKSKGSLQDVERALYIFWFIGSSTEQSNPILKHRNNTLIGMIILFLQNQRLQQLLKSLPD